jgi:hypothetical protein
VRHSVALAAPRDGVATIDEARGRQGVQMLASEAAAGSGPRIRSGRLAPDRMPLLP